MPLTGACGGSSRRCRGEQLTTPILVSKVPESPESGDTVLSGRGPGRRGHSTRQAARKNVVYVVRTQRYQAAPHIQEESLRV